MKNVYLDFLKFGLLLSLFSTFSIQTMAAPTISAITPNNPSVNRYEKLELKVSVNNTVYTNPYNYDPSVSGAILNITFTAPSGTTKTVDGFWKNAYTVSNITNGSLAIDAANNGWYVRFTPTEVGNWTYNATFQDAGGTSATVNGTFSCAASAKNGFVRRQVGKNYLKFDDATPFVPIGQNVSWYGGNNKLGDFKKWLDLMVTHKANTFRLWFCYWAIELEWTTGNGFNYDGLRHFNQSQTRAYELDWLTEYAAANGRYYTLCLQNHGQIDDTGPNNQWATNPYNTANGGTCATPTAYWTDASARATYKNKLRYIMARWGYSPNVLAWELFNEMDLTKNFAANRANAATWAIEMAAYLKNIDPNTHLVSNSYTSTAEGSDVWLNANMDLVQTHVYSKISNMETTMALQAEMMTDDYAKPYLAGEFGTNTANGLTLPEDPNGLVFHNGLWSSLFNGSAGGGLTWWWDEYIDQIPVLTYPVFKQATDFVAANMNVVSKNYTPKAISFTGLNALSDVSITPQFAGFQPPTYAATSAPQNSFTVNTDGSLAPAATNLSTILFNAYHLAARNPPTFSVNYSQAATFKVVVTGRGGSSNSTLAIVVDGITVLTESNPANATYSVNISAGSHTIKVDNTGNEWIQIGEFRLTDYAQGVVPIKGNALRDGNHLVGWLHNQDYNWKYRLDNGAFPPSVSGGIMQITGLAANHNYITQLISTADNAQVALLTATSDGAGKLSVNLPDVAWDMAFRIESAANLPVELLSFWGREDAAQNIALYWQTASEKDISHFIVERSNDGMMFRNIGQMDAVGKTTGRQDYTFLDTKPAHGINYYRLKINELQGKPSFSKTITFVRPTQKLPLRIFPNPATNAVTIQIDISTARTEELTLTDLLGRTVWHQKLDLKSGMNRISMDVQILTSGLYFVRLDGMVSHLVIQ